MARLLMKHSPNRINCRGSGGSSLEAVGDLGECMRGSARHRRGSFCMIFTILGAYTSFPLRWNAWSCQTRIKKCETFVFYWGLVKMPPRCPQGVSQLPSKMSFACFQMPPRCPHDVLSHDSSSIIPPPSFHFEHSPMKDSFPHKNSLGSCAGVMFDPVLSQGTLPQGCVFQQQSSSCFFNTPLPEIGQLHLLSICS